jgi:hypothetical protein
MLLLLAMLARSAARCTERGDAGFTLYSMMGLRAAQCVVHSCYSCSLLHVGLLLQPISTCKLQTVDSC